MQQLTVAMITLIDNPNPRELCLYDNITETFKSILLLVYLNKNNNFQVSVKCRIRKQVEKLPLLPESDDYKCSQCPQSLQFPYSISPNRRKCRLLISFPPTALLLNSPRTIPLNN